MYSLYFKKENNKNYGYTDLVYTRTMRYVTAIDGKGNEIVEFYDVDKFISVIDYFNEAKFVNQVAKLTKPVENFRCDILEQITDNFVMVYISKDLGIGYNEETGIYQIVPTKYLKGYDKGNWELGETKSDKISPEMIVRGLLTQQGMEENKKLKLKR